MRAGHFGKLERPGCLIRNALKLMGRDVGEDFGLSRQPVSQEPAFRGLGAG
jgi:hypothetical protein